MKTKHFDAVQFMREVRSKIDRELAGLSIEAQQAYIERHAAIVRERLSPLLSGTPHSARPLSEQP